MKNKQSETKKMTKLIDKVETHFESVLANGLQGPVEVPEWDEKIWWRPSSTMAEESRVIELSQAGKTTEALVVTLIQKAMDKDGKPLFALSDKLKLMRVADPKVILRVITEMNDKQTEFEDAVKN